MHLQPKQEGEGGDPLLNEALKKRKIQDLLTEVRVLTYLRLNALIAIDLDTLLKTANPRKGTPIRKGSNMLLWQKKNPRKRLRVLLVKETEERNTTWFQHFRDILSQSRDLVGG